MQPFGEQGADAAVGKARGQDGFGTRSSFPAEKAARYFAHRVQAFLELHRQRQEVHIPRLFGHHRCGQQDGVAAGDGNGPVGLLGQSPRFQNDGMLADLPGHRKGVQQHIDGVQFV